MKTKTPSLPFGEPTPLGLLGLAIGCAALLPVAFGWLPKDPAAAAMSFETCAWLCLAFGGACQLLSGLMALANKNVLGGTLLTTFSFNWVMNYWALDRLAHGKVPDATVIACVDGAFLVIFVVLAFAFALVSKVLFALLVDIVALYALRLAHVHGAAIGIATVVLGALALYVALAMLVNDAAGRVLLPLGGPVVRVRAVPPAADSATFIPRDRAARPGSAPALSPAHPSGCHEARSAA